ncbi:MAG: hypothetical protein M1838_006254 [Thelocarpon superellum]|nr:MAG: hypothetical protein M1838_006254 [Thelocarpon superellum]
MACQRGLLECVELLLAKNADVNAAASRVAGVTALQAAAIGGYVAIAMRLLDAGADVNAPAAKFEGRTAIEGAAEHGRLDMVVLLLNAGAEANVRYGKDKRHREE